MNSIIKLKKLNVLNRKQNGRKFAVIFKVE